MGDSGVPVNRIAVVVCSQRVPRVGLQISKFVLNTLRQHQQLRNSHKYQDPDSQWTGVPVLSLIDLAEINLPMYDEPGQPFSTYSAGDYVHKHTRAWSSLVSSYSAFIFVLPEYNRGYPATIKNALDYLYNEWIGKPAMVVSYGCSGGISAGRQLREVLLGLQMRPIDRIVSLEFPTKEFQYKATTGNCGEELGILDGSVAASADSRQRPELVWQSEKTLLSSVFDELLSLLPSRN